ncbi:MAG: acyl-CoA dehydrogenase [Proteobacteria bacterium]|nr:acyl-CoA dehydrogenase [Pseudomonadota bacterium]
MTAYTAPLADIRAALGTQGGLDDVLGLPGCEELSGELIDAILEEAGRFAAEVLAPLNQPGDRQGSRLVDGVVVTPDGFRGAYADFAAGGWVGLTAAPEFGGQGLPHLLAAAVSEIWSSANMAFSLCPMLSQSAIAALTLHGSDQQRRLYLHKLVSGQWTGTMDLTESQAGSDVGALKTKALPDGDHYRIVGEKIFITYGDHDLAENILHMVLARTPGAPAGVRGISLFLVPKFLVEDDGGLGAPNDLRCVSLEHKLGINASPTAVMVYGEDEGAMGWLVGAENQGMECMFTMMNDARMAVGIGGLGIAERAYRGALAYARSRIQGRRGGGPAAIIEHPDVRRMLLVMKARIAAVRGLIYYTAGAADGAERHGDAAERERLAATVDLLTPVVKAFSTDMGVGVASLGIQVHGGAGYIEETGAAQHYRDARIAPIYEGTNGIQASDLLRRKLMRDEGAAARALIAEMAALDEPLSHANDADLAAIRGSLGLGVAALRRATDWIIETHGRDPDLAAAGASPYLALFGTVAGGWQMARAGLAALTDGDDGRGRITTARFYADQELSRAEAMASIVTDGGTSVMALPEGAF